MHKTIGQSTSKKHKLSIGGKRKSRKKNNNKQAGRRGYISLRFGWLKGSGRTRKETKRSKKKRKTKTRKSRR